MYEPPPPDAETEAVPLFPFATVTSVELHVAVGGVKTVIGILVEVTDVGEAQVALDVNVQVTL